MREFAHDTLRLEGGTLVIAAVVALLVGVLLHPHLALLLLPASTCLSVLGSVSMAKQRTMQGFGQQKRRGIATPLLKVSLAQGLNVWRRPRPSKYKQHSLEL